MLEIHYVSDVGPRVADLAHLYRLVFDAPLEPAAIDQMLARPNLLAAVAYSDGRPAGFKVGYTLPEAPDVLYSWIGGTHPDHRRQGIAWRLMMDQHRLAASMGLAAVETKSRPKWAAMVTLNLKAGFTLVREYTGRCGGLKYEFRKDLRTPAESRSRTTPPRYPSGLPLTPAA